MVDEPGPHSSQILRGPTSQVQPAEQEEQATQRAGKDQSEAPHNDLAGKLEAHEDNELSKHGETKLGEDAGGIFSLQ